MAKKLPNCKKCTKQMQNGKCVILGEITEEKLCICKAAGYFDCYRFDCLTDRQFHRHSASTGDWAVVLEER